MKSVLIQAVGLFVAGLVMSVSATAQSTNADKTIYEFDSSRFVNCCGAAASTFGTPDELCEAVAGWETIGVNGSYIYGSVPEGSSVTRAAAGRTGTLVCQLTRKNPNTGVTVIQNEGNYGSVKW